MTLYSVDSGTIAHDVRGGAWQTATIHAIASCLPGTKMSTRRIYRQRGVR